MNSGQGGFPPCLSPDILSSALEARIFSTCTGLKITPPSRSADFCNLLYNPEMRQQKGVYLK